MTVLQSVASTSLGSQRHAPERDQEAVSVLVFLDNLDYHTDTQSTSKSCALMRHLT